MVPPTCRGSGRGRPGQPGWLPRYPRARGAVRQSPTGSPQIRGTPIGGGEQRALARSGVLDSAVPPCVRGSDLAGDRRHRLSRGTPHPQGEQLDEGGLWSPVPAVPPSAGEQRLHASPHSRSSAIPPSAGGAAAGTAFRYRRWRDTPSCRGNRLSEPAVVWAWFFLTWFLGSLSLRLVGFVSRAVHGVVFVGALSSGSRRERWGRSDACGSMTMSGLLWSFPEFFCRWCSGEGALLSGLHRGWWSW